MCLAATGAARSGARAGTATTGLPPDPPAGPAEPDSRAHAPGKARPGAEQTAAAKNQTNTRSSPQTPPDVRPDQNYVAATPAEAPCADSGRPLHRRPDRSAESP